MTLHNIAKNIFCHGLILASMLNIILFINSCELDLGSEPITNDDITGEYIANFNTGLIEKIIIKQDGYYEHYYKSINGIEYIDSANWKLYNEMDNVYHPRILFSDFVNRYPIDAHCYTKDSSKIIDTTPRDWNPYVYKKGRKIRIERCPSRFQYYIKQNK